MPTMQLLHRPTSRPAGARRLVPTLLLAAGAASLGWAAAIHLHLWAMGYRHIPTIGPLFLLQGIAAGVLALVVLATRHPLVAVLGALFQLSTIGGLLLSDWVGLFGFHDHLDAPFAGVSLTVEAVGAALLLAGVGSALGARRGGGTISR
jgi:hypothetical protein